MGFISYILSCSRYYKSIEQKYEEYLKSTHKVNPNEKHKKELNIIDTLLKNILNNIVEIKLNFKVLILRIKRFVLLIIINMYLIKKN